MNAFVAGANISGAADIFDGVWAAVARSAYMEIGHFMVSSCVEGSSVEPSGSSVLSLWLEVCAVIAVSEFGHCIVESVCKGGSSVLSVAENVRA